MAKLKPLPDEVDLYVLNHARTAEGDRLVSEYLAELKKQPGYMERVEARERAFFKRLEHVKQKQAAKRKRKKQRVTAG